MSETGNNNMSGKPADQNDEHASTEDILADLGGIEIKYTPLDRQQIPENIAKHLADQTDDARRLLIARNLVPLPPREMGLTLYALMDDPKAKIREAAEDSFDALPPNIVRTIAGQSAPWPLLDYIARNFYDDNDPEKIIETIVFNKATGDETMCLLARAASPKIVDLIVTNQARLIQTGRIISELPKNKRIAIAQLSRALEFGRRQKIISVEQENRLIDEFLGKAKTKAAIKLDKVVKEKEIDSDGEPDWDFPSFMTQEFEADMDMDADAAIIEEKIKSKLSMRDLVRQMTVPQKLKLASRGNMEARKILINDKLALVATEVLKNPLITATEVEATAESRLVEPEVLEDVAKNASYTRSYQVRHALVTNPKTPLEVASKLMSTLMEKDIKIISKSRSVPQAIAAIARQRMEAQEARRRAARRKKKK